MSTNESSPAFDQQALVDEIFDWSAPTFEGTLTAMRKKADKPRIIVGPEPKFHMHEDGAKMLALAAVGVVGTIVGLAIGSRPMAYYSAFVTGLFGTGAVIDTAFAIADYKDRHGKWESRKERAEQQDADQQ